MMTEEGTAVKNHGTAPTSNTLQIDTLERLVDTNGIASATGNLHEADPRLVRLRRGHRLR